MKWSEDNLPKEYREHVIFQNLDSMNDFYDFLSYSSLSFLPEGLPGTFPNIDTYIFSSIKGTIDSVRLLLKNAHLNDAFAIVRKYFDEILLDVYLTVYRQEQKSKNPNDLLQTAERVKKWIDENFSMPKYNDVIKYFERSKSYKSLFSYFDFDKRFRKIRDVLDDNMHMNSYQWMITNDNEIHNQFRTRYLNLLNTCICDLFCFHFASSLYLNPQYFMASDYVDYLDLGQTPPEGSEKWIANAAQEMFNKIIKPHKELALFLTQNVYLEIDCKYD
ncbi:MAG: hypothetical protein J6W18_05440 [Bacteroidaceae bacterium]|nr:hypothetical protein [Bacteroidaceae bacterium]